MLAGLLACGAATSCMDNLEIDQHGVQSYENYYQTDEQIEAGVVECYQQAQSMGITSFANKALLSDDYWCGGGQRGDNGGYEQLNEYRFSADLDAVQGWFSGYYTGINRCNIIIDKCAENASPVAKRAVAEARVIRALMYFELASMWGTVPLVDHVIDSSEAAIGNTDMATLWKFITDDLNAAISSGALREKSDVSNNDADNWRISKHYAYALLGKTLLWAGDKAGAAQALDQVINSGKYALYEGDYQNILQPTAKNSCESLFETQKGNDANNFEFAIVGCMMRWRAAYFDFSAFNYGAYNIMSFNSGQDYGFYNPTGELMADFIANEGVDGYRLNQTVKSLDWIEQNIGMKLVGNLYGVEEYLMWKWFPGFDTQNWGGYGAMSYTNNYRWMRYSEVLLLAAEANLESDNAKATEYVNQVRRRAQLADKGSVTLADIQLEKRCELCGEGVRYQDIQRWGIAKNTLAKKGEKIPTRKPDGIFWDTKANNDPSKYGYKTGKHEFLPFPVKEIKMNKELQQNPGWE